MKDLYEVLGIDRNATPEEIKKAYKAKASKLHPDKNGGDPKYTAQFQEVQSAYSVLGDAKRRARYDETGTTDDEPSMDEQANNIISSIYMQYADSDNYAPADYITMVRKSVQDALRSCEKDLEKLKQVCERFRYLIDHTAASEAFIRSLEIKLSEIQGRITHAKAGRALMRHSLELLDGYKYTGHDPEKLSPVSRSEFRRAAREDINSAFSEDPFIS